MKYIIPQDKLDKVVFKYLDLKRLEKIKSMYYKGIVFAYPDEPNGILGWETDNTLYIYDNLIDEISETFGLNNSDSRSIIGRWVSNRYQLEVRDTSVAVIPYTYELAIDTN